MQRNDIINRYFTALIMENFYTRLALFFSFALILATKTTVESVVLKSQHHGKEQSEQLIQANLVNPPPKALLHLGEIMNDTVNSIVREAYLESEDFKAAVESLNKQGENAEDEDATNNSFLQDEQEFVSRLKAWASRKIKKHPALHEALQTAKQYAKSFLKVQLRSSLEYMERLSADAMREQLPPNTFHLLAPVANKVWNVFEAKLDMDVPDEIFLSPNKSNIGSLADEEPLYEEHDNTDTAGVENNGDANLTEDAIVDELGPGEGGLGDVIGANTHDAQDRRGNFNAGGPGQLAPPAHEDKRPTRVDNDIREAKEAGRHEASPKAKKQWEKFLRDVHA